MNMNDYENYLLMGQGGAPNASTLMDASLGQQLLNNHPFSSVGNFDVANQAAISALGGSSAYSPVAFQEIMKQQATDPNSRNVSQDPISIDLGRAAPSNNQNSNDPMVVLQQLLKRLNGNSPADGGTSQLNTPPVPDRSQQVIENQQPSTIDQLRQSYSQSQQQQQDQQQTAYNQQAQGSNVTIDGGGSYNG